MTTQFNISKMLLDARQKDRERRVEQNVGKEGNLRAGNSGIMSPTGLVAGHCIRKAHLRQLDIETETISEDKLLMFDLGFASEDIILTKLKSTLPDSHAVLSEEEIPTEWCTENGTRVSGRPDHVICRLEEEGTAPILGLELKSVHSMWTARDVFFQRKPKLANMIQAAHYMWQLNVPYKLIYSSYSALGQGMAGASSGWILKMLPKPGEPLSENVSYTYYRKVYSSRVDREIDQKCTEEEWKQTPPRERSYSIKELKQMQMVYDLRINDKGHVEFKQEHESQDKWTDTIIRIDDIRSYYEYASRMANEKLLGPRPEEIEADGSKAGFSACDYCTLRDTCDTTESLGYEKWLEAVRKHSQSLQDSDKLKKK